MKTNHIYLLQNPSDPDWFKCGETTNPDARLKTFQTGYPQQIEWYGCWIAPKGLSDKHLHPLIAKIATDKRSEWFKGDIREAAEIIKRRINEGLSIDAAAFAERETRKEKPVMGTFYVCEKTEKWQQEQKRKFEEKMAARDRDRQRRARAPDWRTELRQKSEEKKRLKKERADKHDRIVGYVLLSALFCWIMSI